MLRKIIVLELIVAVAVGFLAYRFYDECQKAYEKDIEVNEQLVELKLQESELEKECEDLNSELSVLRENIDLKILEIWKRRVQQLQEELE